MTENISCVLDFISSYYPYGMVMDDRNYLQVVSEAYRYGFNGKELDKPGMGGGQSTYDYGFRIYNPAIAKFLSVDPLTKEYPWYTPYQFAGNMSIAAVDFDGLEIFFAASGNYLGKWGTSTEVRVIDESKVEFFLSEFANANSDPDNWVNHVKMDFYWSGTEGSRSANEMDKAIIAIDHVIPTITNEHIQDSDDCFTAACGTLENNQLIIGPYFGEGENYQMHSDMPSKQASINETRNNGFIEINQHLENGKPILVGVDYKPGSNNENTDKTTEHFIVLTARDFDESGNLYYSGFENVAQGDNERATSKQENRFYVQSDGTLKGKTCFTGNMTITQVRPVHNAITKQ